MAATGSPRPAPLGVGLTHSAAIEPLLDRRPDLVHVLEIEPQTSWVRTTDPERPFRISDELNAHLKELPGRKLIHSVGTPIGGSVRPNPCELSLLRHVAEYFDAPYVSDHLSFNQTPDFSTGFFLPPRQSCETASAVAAAIGDLRAALGRQVAIETGVNYLSVQSDELQDGDFVRRIVEEADCGILLDVHNIYTNARNGRQPVEDFLAQIPLDRVWELHIAGGFEMDGFYLDAHSGAIADDVYALAEQVVRRVPNLGAIIFEIFPSFVPEVGLDLVAEQIERLHMLWRLRPSRAESARAPAIRPALPPAAGGVSQREWESALGSLVIGRKGAGGVSNDLRDEPGVKLVEALIHEFRGSLIVGTLRLTSRLLMLALGPAVFRTIMNEYWRSVPPQMYGSREADRFAQFLEASGIRVPHLRAVMAFETAALATLEDDRPRVVAFDVEPLPLLRALADGRLPDAPLEAGVFEIEITPDGPGLDLHENRRSTAAFH